MVHVSSNAANTMNCGMAFFPFIKDGLMFPMLKESR